MCPQSTKEWLEMHGPDTVIKTLLQSRFTLSRIYVISIVTTKTIAEILLYLLIFISFYSIQIKFSISNLLRWMFRALMLAFCSVSPDNCVFFVCLFFVMQVPDLNLDCRCIHFKKAFTSKTTISNKHIARHTLDRPGCLPTWRCLCFRDLG